MKKYLSVALILIMIATCFVVSIFQVDHMMSSLLRSMDQNDDFIRHIQPFEQDVVFEFDWDAPESNIGKEVFDDGKCSIVITEVRDDLNGGFDIYFRAHGSYNYPNGRLVTACSHRDNDLFYSGTLTSVIGDDTYTNEFPFGMGIFVFNDGDEFGFHAFPLECYERGELIVADQIEANGNTVTMQLSNLYEVTWRPIYK